MTIQLRLATVDDLPFIVRADRESDGRATTRAPNVDDIAHLAPFVRDDDKRAWVIELLSGRLVGVGLCRYRRHGQPVGYRWIVNELDAGLFPPDGRLCEVFQLWVDHEFRRRGLGTRLKVAFEEDARGRGVGAIYTHTAATNESALRLNARLGYNEIRRGPVWDDVVRVSLLKLLPPRH